MDKKVDWKVFGLSGGFILAFVIAAIISIKTVSHWVDLSFNFSLKYFGAFWQVLLLATFIIALILAFSKYGRVKLGGLEKPDVGTFQWIAMIMMTLLAGGGVFWSAAEPIYHFTSVPPAYPGIEAGTQQAVLPALSYSYLHWGFLAWAILGTLSAVVLMYSVYFKGQPLKPRSLLYPVFGDKVINGWLGTVVDSASIIAVAAGTIGPIGFLGLQLSFALDHLFGIPDVYTTQLAIIIMLVLIYTISAATGITKGIQILSKFNVLLAIGVMGVILLTGPGGFILDSFLSGFGGYVIDFLPISLYRGDSDWLGWWTVFYWGWFLGYGPMMAMFVARISRGRTIREIVFAVGVIAPVVTNFWFTVLGGSGIFYELTNPGSVSKALTDSGLPAALFAILEQMPFSTILIPAFLVLIVLFLATTGDSMSYTIAMSVTGDETPRMSIRIFWAVMMGAVAAVLLKVGGVQALQSFIVATAVPVSLILLPMLWTAPKTAAEMYEHQFGTDIVSQKVARQDAVK